MLTARPRVWGIRGFSGRPARACEQPVPRWTAIVALTACEMLIIISHLLAPAQATDLSKMRSEASRAKADLKVAESRIATLQQSTMSREEIRKVVTRLAGDKVCAVTQWHPYL